MNVVCFIAPILWYDKFGNNHTPLPLVRNDMAAIPKITNYLALNVFVTEYLNYEKRRVEMRPDLAGEKKITNFTNWPKCCHSQTPSHPNWTKPQLFD